MSTNHQRQFVNALLIHPNNYLALDAESVVLNPFIDDLIPERLDEEENTPIRYCSTCKQVRLTPDNGHCSKCNSINGVEFLDYERGTSSRLDEYFEQRIFFWRKRSVFWSVKSRQNWKMMTPNSTPSKSSEPRNTRLKFLKN